MHQTKHEDIQGEETAVALIVQTKNKETLSMMMPTPTELTDWRLVSYTASPLILVYGQRVQQEMRKKSTAVRFIVPETWKTGEVLNIIKMNETWNEISRGSVSWGPMPIKALPNQYLGFPKRKFGPPQATKQYKTNWNNWILVFIMNHDRNYIRSHTVSRTVGCTGSHNRGDSPSFRGSSNAYKKTMINQHFVLADVSCMVFRGL